MTATVRSRLRRAAGPGRLRRALRLMPGDRARRHLGIVRLAMIASSLGLITGVIVAVLHRLVPLGQEWLLGLPVEYVWSVSPEPLRLLAMLWLGALTITWLARLDRRGARKAVDAVEANALHGGAMTWRDATAVVFPILVSAWCGAAVGLEAAVTQIGAVLGSLIARHVRLRRSETRLLVAAGAAAAIGAAYHAPIAGMLYAFELVLGTYSKRALAPVALAAVAATVVVPLGDKPYIALAGTSIPRGMDYLAAVVVGAVAALVGIGVMLLVSGVEAGLKRVAPNETVRRLIASVALTGLSWRVGGVLGSGHAATDGVLSGMIDGRSAATLMVAKGGASALSLGGGFRGGMFASSLMIGVLLGQTLAWGGSALSLPTSLGLLALTGMAGVAASIIGSPLAMIFLVLETTGAWDATVAVAISAVTASLLTERLFGYSFATWRFQQRGLALEGGHDVARLRTSAVASLVRPPKRTLAAGAPLADVALALSVSGAKGVAIVEEGRFLGLIDPTLVEIVAENPDMPVVALELIYEPALAITLETSLAEALAILKEGDRSTLAVTDPRDPGRLVGCLRARDVFDAASRHLDRQRAEDLGVSQGLL